MGLMKWFFFGNVKDGAKGMKKDSDNKKFGLFKKGDSVNKNLSADSVKIKVHRLVNNQPVSTVNFIANLVKDVDNNTLIINDDFGFKESLAGTYDSLVSDVLYKLKSSGMTRDNQIISVTNKILEKEKLLKDEKNGYVGSGEKKKKINIQTEKANLRLFKCIKYTLVNKSGEGVYETIDEDGMRCLSYCIVDGGLVPYWYKTPTSNGEPIILFPDLVQRKKFYKSAEDEAIRDYKDGMDTPIMNLMRLISQGLTVFFLLVNVVWTAYLAKWSTNLNDDSLVNRLDELKVQNEQLKQECSAQLINQIENNGVLIDYAKNKIINEINSNENSIIAEGSKGIIKI